LLFHITTRGAWARALAVGVYTAPSLATEGFIHLSRDHQWRDTANRLFRGQRDLVLLVIDPDRLGCEVRDEPADGDVFPHLYSALAVDAVVDVIDVQTEPDR
jgi:uncharacterized protein (DUF952 family)